MLNRIISILLLLTVSFQMTQALEPHYPFSPQVQKSKDHLQMIFNTLYQLNQEDRNIKMDTALNTLLLEKDEQHIKDYIDQQKNLFVKQLNTYIKQGDTSASVALLEFALMFEDSDLKEQINLAPLQQLSDQKDAYASYLLAQQYSHTAQYLPLLEKAGNQGSVTAQMSLADEYGFRLPIEQQNSKKAEFWANQAKQNLGEEQYKKNSCALANCDLESFELFDFSTLKE